MPQLPSLPDQATLFDLLTRFPDIAKYLAPTNDHVMRGPSPLSAKERELIAAFVSSVNRQHQWMKNYGRYSNMSKN